MIGPDTLKWQYTEALFWSQTKQMEGEFFLPGHFSCFCAMCLWLFLEHIIYMFPRLFRAQHDLKENGGMSKANNCTWVISFRSCRCFESGVRRKLYTKQIWSLWKPSWWIDSYAEGYLQLLSGTPLSAFMDHNPSHV